MIFNSSSSIRNDYWPGYNVIDNLNNQIQEVQNEVDLLNINVVANDTSIRADINNLKNQYNSEIITNKLIANAAEVNYLSANFANVNNVNAKNIYVENLTVNKPVWDLTLNTPHIENITVTSGNLFNVNIDGAHFANVTLPETFDNIIANNITAKNIVALDDVLAETLRSGDLLNIEPINSAQAVGYDADGKLIPIHTTVEVNFEFPANAAYLKTTPTGTLLAGISANSIENTNHLVEASALYNFAGGVNADFNAVNNRLVNVSNDLLNIGNSLNDMNNAINNAGGGEPETDPVNWTNNFNFLRNSDNSTISYTSQMNMFNSSNPVNFKTITSVNWLAGPFTDGTDVGGGVGMKLVGTELQFNGTSSITNVTNAIYGTYVMEGTALYPLVNTNASGPSAGIFGGMFRNCTSLTSIDTKAFIEVEQASEMFYKCTGLTSIDTSAFTKVTNAESMFQHCTGLTSINTSAFSNVTNAFSMFYNCTGLTSIDTSGLTNVVGARSMFSKCTSLTSIDTSAFTEVTDADFMFNGCSNLNQDMYLYCAPTGMTNMFYGCTNLVGKNIHILSSIPKDTSNYVYNILVNNGTGVNWTGRVYNDL